MTLARKTMIEKLHTAWPAPSDWMVALAKAVDQRGPTKKIAAILGCSPSLISAAINGSYNGDLKHIEKSVRQSLMRSSVDCPVLGEITGEKCSAHQRTKTVAATNPQTVRLFRACRNGCAHSSLQVIS
ncbi:MAG: hypothetical protein JKX72_03820 [Robiginitomaculum sp.]|nr:hypothetical protein [Robiginitomaculum sp.]